MKNRTYEIAGILFAVVSVFVLLSFISYKSYEEPTIDPTQSINNIMGILGVYISHYLIKMTIGWAAYVLPILGFVWGWWLFSRRKTKPLSRLTMYLLGLAFLTSTALGLSAVLNSHNYDDCGLLGGLLANLFHSFLGTVGTALFLIAAALVLIRGYFSFSFYSLFKKIGSFISTFLAKQKKQFDENRKEKEKRDHTSNLLTQLKDTKELEELDEEEVEEIESVDEVEDEEKIITETEPKDKGVSQTPTWAIPGEEPDEESEAASEPEAEMIKEETGEDQSHDVGAIQIGEEVVEKEVDLDSLKPKTPRRKYQLPSTDLLDQHEEIVQSASHEELVEKANFLVQSLQTFGVSGKVVNISPGPIITLFEVEPAEGVRVNKFVQLADDLARIMEAPRVRIVAPIPGKSSVGIEIPNKKPSIVYLRSVAKSERFAESESKLTVAMGKTTSGESYILELNKLPHLLIAGTTGSGKSVCINSIITSILFRSSPEDVRFILIDPKKLELAAYKALENHHLISSDDVDELVMTTPENAVAALRAAEQEMRRRYDVFAEAVVRNIDEYRTKAESNSEMEKIPYIVVIIDELADLMLRAPKEVEAPITRLAQMSRAVGIHLVVATQRPSVDVITGIIKANFPARLAFQVASRIDSRTILDANGAEKLLGKGDMLFMPPGSSSLIRLHNSFVTLDEINRIVDHVSQQPSAEEIELKGASVKLIGVEGGEDIQTDDELLTEAIKLVVMHQQGSISLIQRRLRVGYSRAARLIDMMEQLGIVGPFTGSKAREVLVDETYLQMLDDDGE